MPETQPDGPAHAAAPPPVSAILPAGPQQLLQPPHTVEFVVTTLLGPATWISVDTQGTVRTELLDSPPSAHLLPSTMIWEHDSFHMVSELGPDFLSNLARQMELYQQDEEMFRTWKELAAWTTEEAKQQMLQTADWEALQRMRAMRITQRLAVPPTPAPGPLQQLAFPPQSEPLQTLPADRQGVRRDHHPTEDPDDGKGLAFSAPAAPPFPPPTTLSTGRQQASSTSLTASARRDSNSTIPGGSEGGHSGPQRTAHQSGPFAPSPRTGVQPGPTAPHLQPLASAAQSPSGSPPAAKRQAVPPAVPQSFMKTKANQGSSSSKEGTTKAGTTKKAAKPPGGRKSQVRCIWLILHGPGTSVPK